MTLDHKRWSEWVAELKKQGLDEPVLLLIKVVKPASILLGQLMTMTLPFFSSHKSYKTLTLMVEMLEDKDQLDAFTRALQAGEG